MGRHKNPFYPNAFREWHGCPETCPESCPFPECTMPSELAVQKESCHCHGWIMGAEGVYLERGGEDGKA